MPRLQTVFVMAHTRSHRTFCFRCSVSLCVSATTQNNQRKYTATTNGPIGCLACSFCVCETSNAPLNRTDARWWQMVQMVVVWRCAPHYVNVNLGRFNWLRCSLYVCVSMYLFVFLCVSRSFLFMFLKVRVRSDYSASQHSFVGTGAAK